MQQKPRLSRLCKYIHKALQLYLALSRSPASLRDCETDRNPAIITHRRQAVVLARISGKWLFLWSSEADLFVILALSSVFITRPGRHTDKWWTVRVAWIIRRTSVSQSLHPATQTALCPAPGINVRRVFTTFKMIARAPPRSSRM